jgi:hypothetical protein
MPVTTNMDYIDSGDLSNGFSIGIVPFKTEEATDLFRDPGYGRYGREVQDSNIYSTVKHKIPQKAEYIISQCLADIIPDQNSPPEKVQKIKDSVIDDIELVCSMYKGRFDPIPTKDLSSKVYWVAFWRERQGYHEVAAELYNISTRLENIEGRHIKLKDVTNQN